MITYPIGNSLYINLTNRCTNSCSFCVRNSPEGVGYDLWLDKEPTALEVIEEIGAASRYDEVVFCGYGEPLLRLWEVKTVSKYLKALGKRVRVNTNGQANAIWGGNIAPELAGLIDAVSISLNAADGEGYQALCHSDYGAEVYASIIEFAKECIKYVPEVTFSVVDIISAHEIEKCAQLAKEIGAGFRVRHFYQ